MKLKHGTTIESFIESLPEKTQEALCDLHGERNVRIETIEGLGRIEVYLDECSEGADRGGYVSFAKLLDIKGPDDQPVTLEEDVGCGWLFHGRYNKLFDWRV